MVQLRQPLPCNLSMAVLSSARTWGADGRQHLLQGGGATGAAVFVDRRVSVSATMNGSGRALKGGGSASNVAAELNMEGEILGWGEEMG
ncbi:hypothetical protein CRG98_013943 [Punica granatum]|uniref:Uncharacterized protein n=1 Tax=Punica granatum TaxID=22663 RepID=A0A2I0KAS8_PUNGR|nr:hypothetical protein CRG98_013943 [Punica granatum]